MATRMWNPQWKGLSMLNTPGVLFKELFLLPHSHFIVVTGLQRLKMVKRPSSEFELAPFQMYVSDHNHSQAGKSVSNVVLWSTVSRLLMAGVWFAPTQTFLSSGALSVPASSACSCLVVAAPCRAPAVKMRPPATSAALTWLSVFFSLDCLSAHWSNPTQGERNTLSNETGVTKRNQPHILFILIDDQVCWWWWWWGGGAVTSCTKILIWHQKQNTADPLVSSSSLF